MYRRLVQLGFTSDEAANITVDYFLSVEPFEPGEARRALIATAIERRGFFGKAGRISKEKADRIELNVPDEFKERARRVPRR